MEELGPWLELVVRNREFEMSNREQEGKEHSRCPWLRVSGGLPLDPWLTEPACSSALHAAAAFAPEIGASNKILALAEHGVVSQCVRTIPCLQDG